MNKYPAKAPAAPVSFWLLMIWAAIMAALVSAQVLAADARFCGGKTIRNPATVRAFKKEWPCIAPCDKTWQVDHIIPLAAGGCELLLTCNGCLRLSRPALAQPARIAGNVRFMGVLEL